MNGATVFQILLVTCVGVAAGSIRCKTCTGRTDSDCTRRPWNVLTQGDCKTCGTVVTHYKNATTGAPEVAASRMCYTDNQQCEFTETEILGIKVRTTCCYNDNCNGDLISSAIRMSVNVFTMLCVATWRILV